MIFWKVRLVAYGARLESVLSASSRGFKSHTFRQELRLIKFILFCSIGIKVIILFTTTLAKVENGAVNNPSVQTMAKIAKVLDVSIEDLFK